MKLKNLKVARWSFFIFHFLFNCLRYKQNNDWYKQIKTKYKRLTVLIFIFDKVERQVHIGIRQHYYCLISLHVISLFTNIPLNLDIKNVEKRWNYIFKYCNVPKLWIFISSLVFLYFFLYLMIKFTSRTLGHLLLIVACHR